MSANFTFALDGPVSTPRATNLSTRLLVGTGNDVGIGGFIVTGNGPRHLLLRGIGPSLSQFGILNFLADPVLELHGQAALPPSTNDNWRDTQEAEIIATGRAPSNDLESAIVADLAPGAYTAILAGNAGTTGVGLVEIYDLSTESRFETDQYQHSRECRHRQRHNDCRIHPRVEVAVRTQSSSVGLDQAWRRLVFPMC